MTNLTTSSNGLNLIKQWEGFVNKPYRCSAGKLTIGYGHKIKPNERFEQPITLAEGQALLAQDAHIAELFINAVLSPDKLHSHPLNQNEFDALVCFTFNLGVGALSTSTLLKKLQAGDRAGAAQQFPRWCNERKGGHMVYSEGLYKRRMDEKRLFMRKDSLKAVK